MRATMNAATQRADVCGTTMPAAVRTLGADDVVDDTTADLADAGLRFDLIIDTAGVTPLRRLRSSLARRGTLVIVGADHRGSPGTAVVTFAAGTDQPERTGCESATTSGVLE